MLCYKTVPQIILFLAIFIKSGAQSYLEVRGGYTHNRLGQDFKSTTFEDFEASGGGYLAVIVTHYVTKTVFFKFGSEWVQKKYLLRRSAPFDRIHKHVTNSYLQLPAIVGLPLISTKKNQLAMSSGVFGGYWLSSLTEGTVPNAFDSFNTVENGEVIQNFRISEYSIKNDLHLSNDHRFEFGLLIEASASHTINSIWSISVHMGYQYALTDQGDQFSGGTSLSNRTMIVSAGLMYKFR